MIFSFIGATSDQKMVIFHRQTYIRLIKHQSIFQLTMQLTQQFIQ